MNKKTIRIIFTVFAFFFVIIPVYSATITVTSIEDSGAGTLRAAIASVSNGDTIDFSTGGNSITVYSSLVLNTRMTIDGGGTQVIGAPGVFQAFVLGTLSSGTTLQNLATVDADIGIGISGADNVRIVNCAIGTDFSDSTGRGHGERGIWVDHAANVIIGTIGQGNVISGNNIGIYVTDTVGGYIQANYIGLASDGETALPNSYGISMSSNTWGSMIGGDRSLGEGNVISANTSSGISMLAGASGNSVCGNIIGLTVSGATGAGNDAHGVNLYGGSGNWVGLPFVNYGNIISDNDDDGIYIASTTGTNNIVQNNIIGLDLAGNSAGNTYGVRFGNGATHNQIGGNRGTGSYESNVISGQTAYDIHMYTDTLGNSVCGNYIGTSIDGSAARDNGAQGVYVAGSGNLIGGYNTSAASIYGNLISGHNAGGRNGVAIAGGGCGNTVVGNVIGLNADGDTAIPNYYGVQIANQETGHNLIGGGTAALSNIISGNSNDGIRLNNTTNQTIVGNLVGLSMDGAATIENGSNAVYLLQASSIQLGGVSAGEGNYITGSTSAFNLSTDSTNNTLVGNYIGVNYDLSASADPPLNGIYANNNQNNFIGIPDTGNGNLFAYCTNGIRLSGTAVRLFMYGNTICANSTHIQFMTSGSNNDKTSPSIVGAYTTYIEGTAEADDFIEIFIAENVSGADGSLSYVGSAMANGTGYWRLDSPSVSTGEYVLATATDLSNGTSELSTNQVVSLPPTPSNTPTVSPTATTTPVYTFTSTPTVTPTVTLTGTITLTSTITPTVTSTSTITQTSTTSPTPTVTATTALGGVDLDGKAVLAYPNPSKDQVYFLMHLGQATEVVIRLYNLVGEKVMVLDASMPAGQGQTLVWQCSDAAPGIYIAKVYWDGEEKQSLKIAIVK